MLVRIEVRSDVVTWSEFENPFRGGDDAEPYGAYHWDWSSVGPFTFDRLQYEAELRCPSGAPTHGKDDPPIAPDSVIE